MTGPVVSLQGVSKRFGDTVAADAVSLDIASGGFFALLGPSGCGKTTLLRLIGGFEAPDAGRILIDGQDVAALPPHRRPVNTVFQSYAVFPHMSVAENVGYGLRMDRVAAAERRRRVEEALALVRLEGLGGRRPDQLSGGQRQRVALARALAKRPRLLLLDEPLSALDARLREEMRTELKELQRRTGVAFLLVTHDQQEALAMADRCALMNAGRLEQVGAPAELYERPASRFVAGFIGEVNLVEATAQAGQAVCPDLGLSAPLPAPAADGTGVWLAMRPERIALDAGGLPGIVRRSAYLGAAVMLDVEIAGGRMLRVLRGAGGAGPAPPAGAPVALSWTQEAVTVLFS